MLAPIVKNWILRQLSCTVIVAKDFCVDKTRKTKFLNESTLMASFAASASAMYSASVDDKKATVFCFLDSQETIHLKKTKAYPDDLLSSGELA